MSAIDNRIIEALRRQQLITEYIVYPFSDIINYQVNITNVPSYSKEDVLVVSDKKILPHWVEVKGSIWVKIPKLIKNTPLKIYTLTGNPSAVSASDGTNTFVAFDDFEGTGRLTWIDNGGTWVNSGGYRKQTNTTAGDLKNTYINISETDYIVHAKFKAISSLGANTREGLVTEKDATSGNSWMEGTLDYTNVSRSAILIPGVGWFGLTAMGFTAAADTWYSVDMLRQANVQKLSIQPIGTPLTWQSQTTQTSRLNKIAGLMGGYEAEVWYDDFFVRKYVSPEPMVKKIKTLNKSLLLKELMR